MSIYKNPYSNIINNGKRLTLTPKIRKKERIFILTSLIKHSTRNCRKHNKERKEVKGIQIGREEIKLSLFAGDMIVYVQNPKESTKTKTKNLLELTSEFKYSHWIQDEHTKII